MARRVMTGGGIGRPSNIYADLALLGQLTNDQEGEIAPEDLVGTNQEPVDYSQVVGTPKFGDVRQNPNPDEYLDNLRKIAQLPMAMSEDGELRQDALENLQNRTATIPDAIQEEQLQGLSGEQGQDQAAKSLQFDAGMIPKTKSGQLQDPLEFIRMRVQEDPSLLDMLPEETKQKLQGTPADAEKGFVPPTPPGQEAQAQGMQPEQGQQPKKPVVPPDQPISKDMVAEYPDQKPQAGAIEQLTEDELLQKDLMDLAGSVIPEEQMNRAKQWQDISTKRKEDLNAEEAALMQKAESGELTTFDKVALGIAIAIPILIALRYGATAGLISAGEGLKGFAGSLQQQQKQQSEKKAEDKKRLAEIQKERLALEEKDIDIDKKIMDSIPDKAARGFLKNKKFRKYGDQLAISTGDPEKTLWLDANKFDTSDEGIKRARKVIEDADETIGVMRDSNKVVNDVLEILDQMPQDTGLWEAAKKNAQWFTSAGGKNPFGGKAPTIDVVDANGKVHKVDAFSQLKQKINLLQDLYNKQILGGTRLTGNVVTHWGGILGDPSSISDWISQDLNTFKDTTKSLKDIMNSREVENLVGKGFVRAPLEQAFPAYQNKVLESDENVFNKMRSNPEAYKGKVK